jgi:hypothetical protein
MFSKTAGPLCVEITLESGQTLKGRFPAPPGRSLTEFLNSGVAFVEFEAVGGQRTFLAKSSLREVTPTNVAAIPALPAGVNDLNGFDPCAVLGVAADASKADVRRAYLQLVKTYHPDRFAAVELPGEVREYLAAMSRRINAAHDTLEAVHRAPARQQPIFTTP